MYDHSRIKNHIGGVESNSYELFGAHLVDGGVSFSVYAPEAVSVFLCADHPGCEQMLMQRDSFGVWNTFIGGVGEGLKYCYKIRSRDGSLTEKSDPFSFYCETRPGIRSIVYDLDCYGWRDSDWMCSRSKNHTSPLNIYEIHAGTWKIKDEKNGDERFYKYEELKTELVPYVRDMGYTHIEFMPLCEFPYEGSWGYQGTGYFAPTSRFGEPRYLMDLIDTCHLNGIGVILDFVPVHFATDEYGLSRFDGSGLYESNDPDQSRSEWGSYRFDYSKPHVQSFVRSAINFWINKYHFDGIRFDAVAYLIYPNGQPNETEYDCGVWFLKNTLYTLNAYHPDVMFIAEDASVHVKDTAPVVYGGFGFDYMWDFGWTAEVLRYISLPFEERSANHDKMTYPMYYFEQSLFMLMISHDDVSNGKPSLMSLVYGRSQEEKLADLKTFYAFYMTHPGKKMSFMGCELAEYMDWHGDNALGWNLLQYPNHDSFHEYVKGLNSIYKSEPALYAKDYDIRAFSWLDLHNSQNSIFAYRREADEGTPLYVVLNFSPYEHDYWLNVGYDGFFRELLNSDRDIYGGNGNVNYCLASHYGYLQLKLAPLSAIILKPCSENEQDRPPELSVQEDEVEEKDSE